MIKTDYFCSINNSNFFYSLEITKMKAIEITLGTEKQIAWAKSLQNEVLKSIAEAEADFADAEMVESMAKHKESFNEMVSIIETNGNRASFWINCARNFSFYGLFRKMDKMNLFRKMSAN